MMFRMARRYDVQSDSILFVNNQPYSRDSYSLAGMGETIEDLLHFCRTMYSMKVDNAEYALLTAIVIFSGKYELRRAPRFNHGTFCCNCFQNGRRLRKAGRWRRSRRYTWKPCEHMWITGEGPKRERFSPSCCRF